MDINIDGLPVYKSSRQEFWPILCKIHELPFVKPLVIGIYSGLGKPNSLDNFLRSFVDDMKTIENGFQLQGKDLRIPVTVRSIICDSPARAYVKGKR